MPKKKADKSLLIFKEELIKNAEIYGISDLKNLRSILRLYGLKLIIPKPFKISLGRGHGVTPVFLFEIIDILHDLIRLKKRGLPLGDIKNKIKNEYWEYHYTIDILYLRDSLHHFGDLSLSSYVNNIEIEGNLENFCNWIKSLCQSVCESFFLNVESGDVLKYKALSNIAIQLYDVMHVLDGYLRFDEKKNIELFDNKTTKLMDRMYDYIIR